MSHSTFGIKPNPCSKNNCLVCPACSQAKKNLVTNTPASAVFLQGAGGGQRKIQRS